MLVFCIGFSEQTNNHKLPKLDLFNFFGKKEKNPPPGVGTSCPNPKKQAPPDGMDARWRKCNKRLILIKNVTGFKTVFQGSYGNKQTVFSKLLIIDLDCKCKVMGFPQMESLLYPPLGAGLWKPINKYPAKPSCWY